MPTDGPYISDLPWYANRGIPIGIIIYLIAMTIAGTAYITNLADRVIFLESYGVTKIIHDNITDHAAITNRLSIIESKITEIQKDLDGKK